MVSVACRAAFFRVFCVFRGHPSAPYPECLPPPPFPQKRAAPVPRDGPFIHLGQSNRRVFVNSALVPTDALRP